MEGACGWRDERHWNGQEEFKQAEERVDKGSHVSVTHQSPSRHTHTRCTSHRRVIPALARTRPRSGRLVPRVCRAWLRGVRETQCSERGAASDGNIEKGAPKKEKNQVVTRADAKVKAARSGNHEDFIRDAQEDAVR